MSPPTSKATQELMSLTPDTDVLSLSCRCLQTSKQKRAKSWFQKKHEANFKIREVACAQGGV